MIYGNVPAEFGEKIGAVINLTTKSGLGSGGVKGEAFVGASRFSTYEGGASVGYGTNSFGLFASVNGSKSDRFVDPVNFDSLHNSGNTARGFLRLDWAPDPSNTFRLTMLAGRTNRDVPNTYTQQSAGQDQRVFTRDANYNVGYQGVLSSNAVLDVSGFARLSTFELDSSPGDTPAQATSRRSLDNFGLAPSITWATGVHEFKVGGELKRFPIEERFTFGITDPALNDPSSPDYNPNLAPYDLTRGGSIFAFRQRRTGTYLAGYAQDNIRLGNFTANVGVRYDHNNLPLSESQLEPRIGAIYYFPSTKTALRVSYNRVLYTPEYENILLSSSPEAAALAPPAIQESARPGGGSLLVHSERQNAYTVGAQQAIGSKARLDVDFWERRSTYAGDQDQLFNTGIVFPLAFSRGDLHGWDLRLDFAQTAGFRGFLSLGHTRAVYVAPPVGGLFLDASLRRLAHRRTVPDRPRPEPATAERRDLRPRQDRRVARRQRALRLRSRLRGRAIRSRRGPRQLLGHSLHSGHRQHQPQPRSHQVTHHLGFLRGRRSLALPRSALRPARPPQCVRLEGRV